MRLLRSRSGAFVTRNTLSPCGCGGERHKTVTARFRWSRSWAKEFKTT